MGTWDIGLEDNWGASLECSTSLEIEEMNNANY